MLKIDDNEVYVVTWVTPTSWDVYNEANLNIYRVDLNATNKRWACNCPQWYFRLRYSNTHCKHIERVIGKGSWNKTPLTFSL